MSSVVNLEYANKQKTIFGITKYVDQNFDFEITLLHL